MSVLGGLAVGAAIAAGFGVALGAAPAPDTAPNEGTRIMFVGDSITGSPGCWRAPVWVSLTDDGYLVDMVGIRTANECGDVVNAAGTGWDPDNTGIGGITTTRMWIKLARDDVLAATDPDVIVMLLGTNDLVGGATPDAILAEYDKLLALYRDHNPNIAVVVGTPPPIDEGVCGCGAAQAALAAAIPGWARDATTADSEVAAVDLGTVFDVATDTTDGVHPNAAGNDKLAAAWTPTIERVLGAVIVASLPPEPSAAPTAAPSPTPTTDAGMPIDEASPGPSFPQLWFVGALAVVAVGVGIAAIVRRRS